MKRLSFFAMLVVLITAYAQTAFAATATLTLNLDDASHVVVSLNYSTVNGLHNGENIITFQDDRYPILDISPANGYAIQKLLVNGRQQTLIGGSWSESLSEDFSGSIIKVTTRELVTRTVTLNVTGAEFIKRCYINDDNRYTATNGISTYDYNSDSVKFSFTFNGNADVKVWIDDVPQDVTYSVMSDTFTCIAIITESSTLKIVATENMIEPAMMNISGVMGIRTIFVNDKLQSSLRDGERIVKLVGEDSAAVKINFMPNVNPTVALDGSSYEILNDAVELTIVSGSTLMITTDIVTVENKINVITDNPEEVTITTGAQDKVVPLSNGLNLLESSYPWYTITFADNGKPHLITVNGEENAQVDDDDSNVYKVYLSADYYNQLKIVTDASYSLSTVEPVLVSLSETELELSEGDNESLQVAIDGADESVIISKTWSSSDTSVATVDQNGCITAHAAGSSVITVTVVVNENGEEYSYTASCNVTVIKSPIHTVEICNLMVTVKDQSKMSYNVIMGQPVTIELEPADGFKVNSVTFNDEAVTVTDNSFTTSAIEADSNIYVEYAWDGEIVFEFTTGVETVNGCDLRVYRQDEFIVIENVESNSQINVYGLSGVKLASTISSDSDIVKLRIAPGVYIITINGIAIKISM